MSSADEILARAKARTRRVGPTEKWFSENPDAAATMRAVIEGAPGAGVGYQTAIETAKEALGGPKTAWRAILDWHESTQA